MGRLIVVSNHVHPSSDQEEDGQEGLAVALSAALRSTSGMWFGWSGHVTEHFSGQIDLQRRDGITTALVDLEAQDAEEYFGGFATRTLWPLFHSRVDLAEHERGYACGYHRVNERFAETMMPIVASDDLIWVHDYHLIPLGAELRRRGCRNRIGFFLHTPWPPRRLLTSLPGHQSLVEAMFDYDLIGFQTHDCADPRKHGLPTRRA